MTQSRPYCNSSRDNNGCIGCTTSMGHERLMAAHRTACHKQHCSGNCAADCDAAVSLSGSVGAEGQLHLRRMTVSIPSQRASLARNCDLAGPDFRPGQDSI